MTGYGRGRAVSRKRRVSVEIKSVNNRYFDLQIKGLHLPAGLENEVAGLLKSRIQRGAVTLVLNVVELEKAGLAPVVNRALARQYRKIYREVGSELGLDTRPSTAYLLGLPNVITLYAEDRREKALWPELKKALAAAVREFDAMRIKEGRNLARDLARRVSAVGRAVQRIETDAPARIPVVQARLHKKLTDLLDGRLDEPANMRLLTEVSLLADKIDISEEITRLKSHLGQFSAALKGGGPVGKRLNFILQEIGREANTVSSKAGHEKIVRACIQIKEEAEKMREQIQNLE
jgi:uncharacterized protein (TIGR00255 family)